jgi:parallel beta-helix repeat protein
MVESRGSLVAGSAVLILAAACSGGGGPTAQVGGDASPARDGGTRDARPPASDSSVRDSGRDSAEADAPADASGCRDAPTAADGGMPLTPGTDLSKVIASSPAGTRFLLACGTYRIATDDADRKPLIPKSGDQFVGAGPVCGVPTSEPCVHITGAIRVPADSPDTAWHSDGGLWFNAVGATNVVAPPTDNTALCWIRNGSGSCTNTSAYGACVYPQDLFFESLPKARLSAGDNGGVDEWPPSPGFWYFDVTGKHGSANTLWVADDPTSTTVELSVVDGAFRTFDPEELNPNVVLQNLTIEKFAGPYGTAAIWAYGDGWQVLNNWIEHNHYAGVVANGSNGVRPQKWLVQFNELYENGNGGAGGPSIESTFSNNQFDRNGWANYCNDSGQKWEGTSPLISDNVVNHTNGVGLWFDVSTESGTFTRNTIAGGSGEGIRCEISHGCTITSNVLSDNEQLTNDLCVAPHVPWPAGNDCCTGPQTGTCPATCLPGSVAPNEVSLAQSDNSTVGGAGTGNTITSACGGIGLSTGTRDTADGGSRVPNTGNSVTYNTVTYSGSSATVPHPYGYNVADGGVVPAPNTFDHNDYHFVDAGAGAVSAANWQAGSGRVTFSKWQAVPQDQHGKATSP